MKTQRPPAPNFPARSTHRVVVVGIEYAVLLQPENYHVRARTWTAGPTEAAAIKRFTLANPHVPHANFTTTILAGAPPKERDGPIQREVTHHNGGSRRTREAGHYALGT